MDNGWVVAIILIIIVILLEAIIVCLLFFNPNRNVQSVLTLQWLIQFNDNEDSTNSKADIGLILHIKMSSVTIK